MFEVLFEVLDKSAAKKAPAASAAKSGLHVVAGATPVTAAVMYFVLKHKPSQ
jgi:hypothetical protein